MMRPAYRVESGESDWLNERGILTRGKRAILYKITRQVNQTARASFDALFPLYPS